MKSSQALSLVNTAEILARDYYKEVYWHENHNKAEIQDDLEVALLRRCEASLREVAFLLSAIKKSRDEKREKKN